MARIAGWVQSRVRDPGKRQIVQDLDTALRAYLERGGHDRAADLLLKSSANLPRMGDESVSAALTMAGQSASRQHSGRAGLLEVKHAGN